MRPAQSPTNSQGDIRGDTEQEEKEREKRKRKKETW